MIWTSTNLVIQIVTGVLGAHFAASAAHEHGFGFFGHTIAGLIAGAFSGYFLQKLAVTVVTAVTGAAASTRGLSRPSGAGTVMTRRGTPATLAGTAFIMTEDG